MRCTCSFLLQVIAGLNKMADLLKVRAGLALACHRIVSHRVGAMPLTAGMAVPLEAYCFQLHPVPASAHLQEKQGGAVATSPSMLKDLAVYLTLEKAQV